MYSAPAANFCETKFLKCFADRSSCDKTVGRLTRGVKSGPLSEYKTQNGRLAILHVGDESASPNPLPFCLSKAWDSHPKGLSGLRQLREGGPEQHLQHRQGQGFGLPTEGSRHRGSPKPGHEAAALGATQRAGMATYVIHLSTRQKREH